MYVHGSTIYEDFNGRDGGGGERAPTDILLAEQIFALQLRFAADV